MAGNIYLKERAIITLTSSGASLATLSAGAANGTADLNATSAGNAPDDMQAVFQLTCQWGTITGIVAATVVADLYLVPLIDGSNLPQIDLTSGASFIPYTHRVGSFIAGKAPTATTDTYFATAPVDLSPVLMRPYILNRSGQTITANWTLKVVPWQMQYS